MEDLPLNQSKLTWTLIKCKLLTLGNTQYAELLQASLQSHLYHTHYPITVAYWSYDSRLTQVLTH